jgi:hypothetical protein
VILAALCGHPGAFVIESTTGSAPDWLAGAAFAGFPLGAILGAVAGVVIERYVWRATPEPDTQNK